LTLGADQNCAHEGVVETTCRSNVASIALAAATLLRVASTSGLSKKIRWQT
jgi:hypothetical protein